MADYLARVSGHFGSGNKWGFGWKISSNQSLGALLTTWETAVSSWWTDSTHGMNTFYPTTTILDQVDVTAYGAPGKFSLRAGPILLTLAGSSSDNGLPDINAPVLSMRSATIGKGTDGRTKLPAPVEGVIVAGELTTSFIDRAGIAARALFSAVIADGSSVFIWNTQETISKPTPFTKTVINTIEASNKMGTERSRVRKVRAAYA